MKEEYSMLGSVVCQNRCDVVGDMNDQLNADSDAEG